MRLLVANRGEIAVRILRSAKELGLETVAVYSDADRLTPHVRLADRAVRLGPAPAAESYLRSDAIIAAALETSCDAVHPGYGFLSEDAAFARACEDAGLVFAGPSPEHLEVFGSKHTAREAAIAAGVPLLPGTGLLSDVDEAVAHAAEIGYPVMLKATGGGGGIGMRACATPGELRLAWDDVQSTAAKSFSRLGGVPGTAGAPRPARRGPGVRRRLRRGPRPRHARLLAAAAQPEGRRGVPGAGPARRRPPSPGRLGRRAVFFGAVPLGGHGRVRLRPRARRGGVPRGQHPVAGRAPGHRGGVRRRPGRLDAAARAGRPRDVPGRAGGARARRRGTRVRRGPERLPPAERGPRHAVHAAHAAPGWTPGSSRARPSPRTTTRCWPR